MRTLRQIVAITNVALKLDEDLLREARVIAAETSPLKRHGRP
jgi:hypothetical protein